MSKAFVAVSVMTHDYEKLKYICDNLGSSYRSHVDGKQL